MMNKIRLLSLPYCQQAIYLLIISDEIFSVIIINSEVFWLNAINSIVYTAGGPEQRSSVEE